MKAIGTSDMRVLVTGANGFTGQYVKRELVEHGYTVIDLKSDLLDANALDQEIKLAQPTAVIHLAAVASVTHDNANDFYQTNVIGTRNLLQNLYRYAPNVSGILLASSANVYGNKIEGRLDESVLPKPANDYAVSKLAMENMALLWERRLPVFIVRPFNYTGVGQHDDFVVPKIVRHFRDQAAKIELGNVDVEREFNDVRMFAEVYRKLLVVAPVGKIINVCTAQGYTLQQVIEYCEHLTGHQLTVKVNQKFRRANEVKSLVGDNSRLRRVVGDFHICGLKSTLQWMLSN